MYDILFLNGKMVDGSGAPWRYMDVAVKGDRIAAVGKLSAESAKEVIDIRGKVICPGFIDSHTHTDLTLLADYRIEARLKQGITTEVPGQDGLSYAPCSEQHLDEWRRYLIGLNGSFEDVIDWNWKSTAELLERYEGRAANVAWLVPHGAVRVEALGWEGRAATSDELKIMTELVEQAMSEGACGISTGLTYMPCCFATTEEMIELCKPVAKYGGILSIHMRSYGAQYREAIEEVIEIGKQTGCAMHISHLRVADRGNWGNSNDFMNMLQKARDEDVDITADLYPYAFGNAPLFCLTPVWAQAGGPDKLLENMREEQIVAKMVKDMQAFGLEWGDYLLSNCPKTELGDWEGYSISSAAELLQLEPEEFVLLILSAAELDVAIVASGGSESDNDVILPHPLCIVGSDGILMGNHPHPRGFGTFPRFIRQYVRERNILSLEQAIYKMTGFPASRLNIADRGLLKTGMAADLVVFSEEEIADTATFADVEKSPLGIEQVYLNGKAVILDGEFTNCMNGRVLKPLLMN